ncbi:MAG TPA: DUF6263 family protein, partial [Verrucomicrobiae bacterium]|nr:DUF6263 family protein [Verrucomicrobiae bacterium]
MMHPLSRRRWAAAMVGFGFCIAALLFFSPALARADALEDQYLQIHDMVQQADTYQSIGLPEKALAEYRRAQAALLTFQHLHPNWEPNMVAYRLSRLSLKTSPAAARAAEEHAPKHAATSGSEGVSLPSGVSLRLIDAGSAPRHQLRYRAAPGQRETLIMTMTMTIDMKTGNMESTAMKVPAITTTVEVTPGSPAANGDIPYSILFKDASISDDANAMPQIAEALRASLDDLRGMTGSGVLSPNGMSRRIKLNLPGGTNARFQQTMDQMQEMLARGMVALPREAVGVGAKWEVKMPVKTQGMAIAQTAEYQIISLQGDHATLRSSVSQTANRQQVSNPAMPGVKFDLTRMTGSGSGEMMVDFSKLLPP